MLDCGAHPGREGEDSLPYFDLIEENVEIDLILITHFHIDHCAALPYFLAKKDFTGKIYMTHATKAVMKLLLSDNIRLQSHKQGLYNEQVRFYPFLSRLKHRLILTLSMCLFCRIFKTVSIVSLLSTTIKLLNTKVFVSLQHQQDMYSVLQCSLLTLIILVFYTPETIQWKKIDTWLVLNYHLVVHRMC